MFEIRWKSMKYELSHIISWILLSFEVKKGVKRPFLAYFDQFSLFCQKWPFWSHFGRFWAVLINIRWGIIEFEPNTMIPTEFRSFRPFSVILWILHWKKSYQSSLVGFFPSKMHKMTKNGQKDRNSVGDHRIWTNYRIFGMYRMYISKMYECMFEIHTLYKCIKCI